ncbi:transporter, UIT6 family [Candidatus Kryptonium thompsonii]|uniref:Transporter, UIT6 family n=2 Tax=Candidatus Kryptonium thompsonii TaxID=1633631 RepID=A0A0P1LWC2_9BACT|nr:sodium:proton antiporter [Candidatus Kryptonium thompsoni]CUS86342.1 transporter, UIT6 family [Candidatus Kryptonium thompsoni]CUS87720.1 transporter, UIT6 family [Candidatus Kryptonium thompsoni]CUS88813.1 transporter, UIT6 family [Candidatus Kryptonium thompsoni]CUU05784.1 transporter, UIT6 family [Candidatus Kryptonium thompsoni]
MKKIIFGSLITLILLFFQVSDAFAIEYEILPVNPVMITPFILLLLAIAVMPFINRHWWEHNYPFVSFALGAVTVIYYFFILKNAPRMLHTAIEYFSFISLIGSLFVVAGGIHIRVKGRSTPLANVILLGIGSVISNLLGTTGASMVLIRPYIRLNKYRISGYHIVFFIFIVSNIGGMLTPIGDPPLFLGYLKGIPFFWVITKVWHIWLISVGTILLIFFLIDRHHYKKLPDVMEKEIETKGEEAVVEGLHNVIFLAIILGAVFLKEPIRETIMIGSAIASYLTTKKEIHERNDFNFIPIKEVAILFAGIFATMVPALDWLELNAEKLGITHPGQFFWGTGILSGFLDNAPTYLNFLSAAFGLHGLSVDNPLHMKAMLGMLSPNDLSHLHILHNSNVFPVTPESWKYIQAISVGAVIFGAMTYIGNGPNFMVKSIAEQAHVKMPSFFGYMIKYSIPILLPIYTLIWFIFFRTF